MRAISLELDDAQAEPHAASAAIGVAAPAAPAAPAAAPPRRLATLWQAMPHLVRVMFALDLLTGLLYVLSRRTRDVIGKPLVGFFDLNGEGNFPSWYSSIQLALIGGLLIIFAATKIRRRALAAWCVMIGGAAFLFLSLDEMTAMHEHFGYWLDRFGHRRETIFDVTGFWMLWCAPPFLAMLAVLGLGARRYLRGRRAMAMKFAAGALVYVGAAAGVEALTNFVTPHSAPARALVLLEEMGEMLGATMMLWGVCELLRGHGMRLLVSGDANGNGKTPAHAEQQQPSQPTTIGSP